MAAGLNVPTKHRFKMDWETTWPKLEVAASAGQVQMPPTG